jgi:hypothetical protein
MDRHDHLFSVGGKSYRARLLTAGMPEGPAIALFDQEASELIARLTYPLGLPSGALQTFGGPLDLDALATLRRLGDMFIS